MVVEKILSIIMGAVCNNNIFLQISIIVLIDAANKLPCVTCFSVTIHSFLSFFLSLLFHASFFPLLFVLWH